EAMARFRIGYAPDSRGRLKTALTGAGVTESLLVTAGLLIVPEDGRASYDRFRGRVIFPIFDRRGRPVAFGGRMLGEGTPKYLNSPDTPLFQKGHLLYGWSHALKGARETGTLVVCEGYMDVIALIRAGIPAMAPLGTAMTESQILALWRVVPEPVLSFDGDAAGARAAMRAAERALPLLKPGCSFRILTLPRGEDPDSLVRSRGARGMESLMVSARPLADVIWDMETRGRAVDTPERRAAVEKGLMNRARAIADRQVQDYYVRDFRRRLREAFADFSPVAGARRRAPGAGFGLGGTRRRLASDPLIGTEDGLAEARERVLVTTVLNHPDLLNDIAEEFTGAEIGSHELNSLRQAILDAAAAREGLDAEILARELATLGFGRLVEGLVGPRGRVLDWFARPDAARDDALTGFRHALELHHRFGVGKAELDACESTFAADPTEENWARLQAVKSELQTALAHEGRLDDYGAPVKGPENG
ncbi:MAG: DNA primase, partial [Alphaproteobacteria bacterium]